MMNNTRWRGALCTAWMALVAPSLFAQACPEADLPLNCDRLVPGTPLPFENTSAPPRLELPDSEVIELVIVGHSESRGYDDTLAELLEQRPILPNVRFQVRNEFIGGAEAWQWTEPGLRGYDRLQQIYEEVSHPMIVLGLFTNNRNFPIEEPSAQDPDYLRFVDHLEVIADSLHDNGAIMVYFSAHRFKVGSAEVVWNENCTVGRLMKEAGRKGKDYIKPGPAQHDLHWCYFPEFYDEDLVHTNDAGDELMAQTWYNFLVWELTGQSAVPYGVGKPTENRDYPALRPSSTKFPQRGIFYDLTTTEVNNNRVFYFFGGEPGDGNTVLVNPFYVVVDPAIPGQDHVLNMWLPDDPLMDGFTLYVQSGFQDALVSHGLALSQGLAMHFPPARLGEPPSKDDRLPVTPSP